MNAETLSYCARLKQRAEVSAVIRLAACFLELWEDNEGDSGDEAERGRLAAAKFDFEAARQLVEAAPQLRDTLVLIAENAPAEDPGEGDWSKGLDSAFSAGIEAGRFEAAKLARDALSGVAGERWTVLLLRPDYLASDYGTDTYLAHVEAESASAAVYAAQQEVAGIDSAADGIDVDRCTDYVPLLCIRGHHLDTSS